MPTAASPPDEADQYLAVFNALQVGIVVHDAESRLLLANSTAERLLGHPVAKMRGCANHHPIWRFLGDDEAPLPIADYPVEQALRTGRRVDDVVMGIVHPDGSVAWVTTNAYPITGPDGAVRRVVTSFTTITELRKVRRMLTGSLSAAEAATRAKSAFVANMSHELRTPLTAVIGFGQALERLPDLPESARAYSRQIVKGGAILLSLVNNVLDHAELESEPVRLTPETLDPRTVAETVVELLAPQASAKSLDLRLGPVDALPPVVQVDRVRLQQILLNLVGNAVKFTRTGEVEVSGAAAEGGAYTLAVRDTGPGIEPERLHALFRRFSRGDGADRYEVGGAGLGLAISQTLARAMGGRIDVASTRGRGSVFTLTLPLDLPIDAPEEPPPPDPPFEPVAVRRMDVLIVEDSPANQTLLRALLEPICGRVTVAADGIAGVETASAADFDLILMDIRMPRMDGIAAARAIRQGGGRNHDTPIIALSAEVSPERLEELASAGFNDHVVKPFDHQHLWAVMIRCAG